GCRPSRNPRGKGSLRMRRLRIMTLCLVGACGCGVLAVSSASAALPELGRCVSEPGKGAFTRSSCAPLSKTHTGNFEWLPGPGASPAVKENFNGALLETVNGGRINCTAIQLFGEYTGPKSETF